MRFLDECLGWIRALIGYLFLGVTLLGINALQILSLLILPFSHAAFREINRFFAATWWGWCVVGTERFLGVEPVFSGDEVPPGENAIVFANHQQMPDILVLMMVVYRKNRLGDLKWFVKDPIKYVPGIGWGMFFLDCIFVKRDWMADRARIETTFRKFKTLKIPLWLVTFVEGTRVTPAKLQKSQDHAREKGLKVLQHVMIPRTRGFCAALEGLEGHADAVYDVTIGYVGGVPTLTEVFRGKLKKVRLDVRRFAIKDLPSDAAGRAAWLQKRFEIKDTLLDSWKSL